jgi:lipooligosaccharide transport system ATP-binding protein
VLELRFAPDQQDGVADRVRPLAERVEVLPDRLLLYTSDGDAALNAAYRYDVRPQSSLVRRSTLEDVSLRLTGRSLVD